MRDGHGDAISTLFVLNFCRYVFAPTSFVLRILLFGAEVYLGIVTWGVRRINVGRGFLFQINFLKRFVVSTFYRAVYDSDYLCVFAWGSTEIWIASIDLMYRYILEFDLGMHVASSFPL